MPSCRARETIDRKPMSRPVPCALRTKRLSALARGNRSRYLRRRRYARRAPPCCAVLPIVRGRETAVAACWLRKGSTAVVIGHDVLSTYRRFLRGQSRQGFAEGMFVSRRRRNRGCAKASASRLNRASLYAEALVMHPDAIATGFGIEAVLRLWRIAIFRTGFPSGLD